MLGLEIVAEAILRFNNNLYADYVASTPLALAFERLVECRIYLNLPFERPILDIGCGDGIFSKVLFAEQIDTGIDPNPVEIEHARKLGGYHELLQCYGASVPKPDGTYRTIFSNSVLEHIPDLKPVLKEANRLLAPGGRFYFTVPSENFERFTTTNLLLERVGLGRLSQRYRRFFNRFWVHYHAYKVEKWIALGKEAGFEIVDAYTYNPAPLCLLNAALTPLALPNMITKKLTNRWMLFPGLRRLAAKPISKLAAPMLRGGERAPNGGLVFVALQKI